MRFAANYLFAQIDEEIDALLIGFADDEFETEQYVLLQKILHPTKEDQEDGTDQIHISFNDQSQSMYGGIRGLSFSVNQVEITLTEKAAMRLNTDTVIQIHFDAGQIDTKLFDSYFKQMFESQQEVYESAF